ncbi:MAG TPA: TetR family transcriptional regulator C-terminal domain-containing protein, partial [Streptosporangiaceae bacterium]
RTPRLWNRLHRHLVQAAETGELRAGVDLDFATHQLVVLIDGLSAERVLYPDRTPTDRQVSMLNQLLANLAA